METPQGLATALRWIGFLLILFALADFGLSWIGLDITGSSKQKTLTNPCSGVPGGHARPFPFISQLSPPSPATSPTASTGFSKNTPIFRNFS